MVLLLLQKGKVLKWLSKIRLNLKKNRRRGELALPDCGKGSTAACYWAGSWYQTGYRVQCVVDENDLRWRGQCLLTGNSQFFLSGGERKEARKRSLCLHRQNQLRRNSKQHLRRAEPSWRSAARA